MFHQLVGKLWAPVMVSGSECLFGCYTLLDTAAGALKLIERRQWKLNVRECIRKTSGWPLISAVAAHSDTANFRMHLVDSKGALVCAGAIRLADF